VLVSDVSFRPLRADDLPAVAHWLGEDHVRRWWKDACDLDQVTAEYLPRIAGEEPPEVFVIVWDAREVGIIQRYRLSDYPTWTATVSGSSLTFPNGAGIDYFIGEPDIVGQGVGSAMIFEFSTGVFARYPDVTAIVVTPQAANRASCRALEKAGYHLVWTGMLDSDDPSDAGLAALYVLNR
jgi:RimJ/RimL family protein N-acetyltransferase